MLPATAPQNARQKHMTYAAWYETDVSASSVGGDRRVETELVHKKVNDRTRARREVAPRRVTAWIASGSVWRPHRAGYTRPPRSNQAGVSATQIPPSTASRMAWLPSVRNRPLTATAPASLSVPAGAPGRQVPRGAPPNLPPPRRSPARAGMVQELAPILHQGEAARRTLNKPGAEMLLHRCHLARNGGLSDIGLACHGRERPGVRDPDVGPECCQQVHYPALKCEALWSGNRHAVNSQAAGTHR